MSESEMELTSDSPEALMRLFEERGWGDGLPLVPPTKDRVDAMLAVGTGEQAIDADELIWPGPGFDHPQAVVCVYFHAVRPAAVAAW